MSDEMSDTPKDKTSERWKQIERFLESHDIIQNADVRQLCNVSAVTANRILSGFVAEGRLAKCREGGHWGYRRMDQRKCEVFVNRVIFRRSEEMLVLIMKRNLAVS